MIHMKTGDDAIKQLLGRHFDVSLITDEDDFFEKGLVSSLIALELLALVEKQAGITCEPDDISLANFRSIAAIRLLIERLKHRALGAHK